MDLYGDDEIITFTEECEHNHARYLAEFFEKVWPVLERQGISRDTALLYWSLTKCENMLEQIAEAMESH